MTTVLFIRHGRSTANTAGVLAGRTPGVDLDERGRAQAAALAARLGGVRLDAVVASPLERTRQTAEPLLADRPDMLFELDERFNECDYGTWSGRTLKSLAEEPLWRTVQAHPAAAAFPDGESLAALSARAVAGVRAWNAKLGSRRRTPSSRTATSSRRSPPTPSACTWTCSSASRSTRAR